MTLPLSWRQRNFDQVKRREKNIKKLNYTESCEHSHTSVMQFVWMEFLANNLNLRFAYVNNQNKDDTTNEVRIHIFNVIVFVKHTRATAELKH